MMKLATPILMFSVSNDKDDNSSDFDDDDSDDDSSNSNESYSASTKTKPMLLAPFGFEHVEPPKFMILDSTTIRIRP